MFTALEALQHARDLEMAKEATELEIEIRQALGLPLVRHVDIAGAASTGKGK